MGSVEKLFTRLETFRRTAAGRTGIIDFPNGLSIINCCWCDEGERGSSPGKDCGSSRIAVQGG